MGQGMSDHKTNLDNQLIHGFDLNLLEVFELVYVFESVREASLRLGRSSSAISQSLNKLREMFSDPLFVRSGTRLVKTATAVNIHSAINENYLGLLNNLQQLVSDNVRHSVNVFCSPYCGVRVLPVIMNFVTKSGIDCNLIHQTLEIDEVNLDDQLSLRQVDLIFDINPIFRADIINTPVSIEPLIWVCSKNHPRIKDTLTAEMIHNEKFVTFNSQGLSIKQGQENIKDKFGQRNSTFSSASVFATAAVVEQSELISPMPEWLFKNYGSSHQLKQIATELPLPDFTIYMISRKSTLKNDVVRRISEGVVAGFQSGM